MATSDVEDQIKRLGIRPNKKRGQHYLVDKRIANRQVQYGNIVKDDIVLEIGPGLGILTGILSERARRVIAVEMDPASVLYLKDVAPEVEVIQGDILDIDLPRFDKVVSNLPYNISSPVTFKLLDEEFEVGILMYQKEFAERLVASKGSSEYSRLSVNSYYKARCEILEEVPRTAFYPVPKVDSSILRLTPRPPPFRVDDEDHFQKLVRALFNHRRKQIGNSLLLEWKELCDSKDEMKHVVSDLPNAKARVEDLSPEDIGELSNKLVGGKV